MRQHERGLTVVDSRMAGKRKVLGVIDGDLHPPCMCLASCYATDAGADLAASRHVKAAAASVAGAL